MKSREIGSEFWDAPITEKENDLFPKQTQWYLSGRSALKAILSELGKCHSVAIPAWCCDSMVTPFIQAGIQVHFYPVCYQNGKLIQEPDTDRDILFLMDYFGYTRKAADTRDYRGIVIRDVTHSLFSEDYTDADYYFGSLRKWCGIRTGGYAWTRNGRTLPEGKPDESGYTEMRERAMHHKAAFIVQNNRREEDKIYLNEFEAAEQILEETGIVRGSIKDTALAKRLDTFYIREKRRENANVLREALMDWLIFPEMRENDCPMFVPILVPDGKRDELRKRLISERVYCPVHWPISKEHALKPEEQALYENELSIVCDQRYTKVDMHRIVEIINLFRKGIKMC